MANGAIEHIHQVADLGPIIGFVAVLKSATQILIESGPLMDQGFEVHFAKSGVGIFLHNELIYKGTYDKDCQLFQIIILDLILPSSPSHHPQISDEAIAASNNPLSCLRMDLPRLRNRRNPWVNKPSRKKKKNERQTETIDPSLTKEALWLHKHMGHLLQVFQTNIR